MSAEKKPLGISLDSVTPVVVGKLRENYVRLMQKIAREPEDRKVVLQELWQFLFEAKSAKFSDSSDSECKNAFLTLQDQITVALLTMPVEPQASGQTVERPVEATRGSSQLDGTGQQSAFDDEWVDLGGAALGDHMPGEHAKRFLAGRGAPGVGERKV